MITQPAIRWGRLTIQYVHLHAYLTELYRMYLLLIISFLINIATKRAYKITRMT